MGLLSSVFGGNGAYKKSRRRIDENKRLLQQYYGGVANQSYAQTPEGAAAIARSKQSFEDANKQHAVQQGLTGGTAASTYLQQESANKALASQQSQMSVAGQSRRDDAMRHFVKAATDANNALNQIDIQQAQQEAQALGGLINAGMSFASGALSGQFSKGNAKNG